VKTDTQQPFVLQLPITTLWKNEAASYATAIQSYLVRHAWFFWCRILV